MKKTEFPFPRKYWIYVSIFGVFAILLFVNIFVTDGLTGEKEFWDFSQQDWCYFALFLLTEIVIALFMFLFAVKDEQEGRREPCGGAGNGAHPAVSADSDDRARS